MVAAQDCVGPRRRAKQRGDVTGNQAGGELGIVCAACGRPTQPSMIGMSCARGRRGSPLPAGCRLDARQIEEGYAAATAREACSTITFAAWCSSGTIAGSAPEASSQLMRSPIDRRISGSSAISGDSSSRRRSPSAGSAAPRRGRAWRCATRPRWWRRPTDRPSAGIVEAADDLSRERQREQALGDEADDRKDALAHATGDDIGRVVEFRASAWMRFRVCSDMRRRCR